MRTLGTIIAALALVALAAAQQPPPPPAASPAPAMEPDHRAAGEPRFETLDLYIDAGGKPLGAYQVEIKAVGAASEVKAVGIEGGESAAYQQAPYYDPAALHDGQLKERIVLAAFNTAAAKDLPAGRTRVARVHVRVVGAEPEYVVKLMAAGTEDGSRIEAKAEVVPAK